MAKRKYKKSARDNPEKRVLKILEELKNPIKHPLRVIGYFLSNDGETRTEIGFKTK